VVVSGEHNGSSNFIVRLVGPSDTFGQLLFNEIGGYQGETAWPDAKAISYKLAVQADGAWSIRLTQPVPTPDAIPIPGTVQGQGDKVVAIRATSTMQATVTGSNTGSSNFIVRMYGYGSTAGYWQLVFNEIGPYQGQRLVSIPAGPYLLHVLSNGNWSIGFAR